LNDRAYSDRDPQPQSVVWERMNLPIARGLRGLIYVLWDLSEIDPSDLSILLAGNGRMRIGFGEIDPAGENEAHDPTDAQIRAAVDACWQNPYCAFAKEPGTSLVCIQGDWSNMADAKIKSEIASRALGNVPDARYNPLYARAVRAPRPWGVTALFTEYTGTHAPAPLVWTSKRSMMDLPAIDSATLEIPTMDRLTIDPPKMAEVPVPARLAATAHLPFATVGDLARAMNRQDPIALEIAAGVPDRNIVVDGLAVRKFVGAVWFRSIFPKLSVAWRDRLLEAIADSAPIPNHSLPRGRQPVHLADGSHEDLKAIAASTTVAGPAGADLHLVLAITGLWGEEARSRLRFVDVPAPEPSPKLTSLFGLRR
jgi:hypothetical protein